MTRISVDFPVSNLIEDSPASIDIVEVTPQKLVVMLAVKKVIGTLGQQNVSIENNDVNVKFKHPKGPALKFFCPSKDDVCWVPAEDLTCEANPPEASTTGKFYVFEEVNIQGLFPISMFYIVKWGKIYTPQF